MNYENSENLKYETEDIKNLFMKLSFATSKNDHQEVVKLSDKIQTFSILDTESEKSRVIALIKLDKYEEALQTILHKLNPDETKFETTYCLFMLEKFKKALSYLEKDNERSHLHVKAQILYQMGQTIDAVQLYKKLIQDPYRIENEDFDLNVNLLAAQVTSPSIEISSNPAISQSLDYRFNIGCHLIHKKEYKKAKILFELSREQCLSNTHKEDIPSILDPILIQLAYIYSFLDQESDALNIYEDLMNRNNVDPVIKMISTNNFFSIKSEINPYLAFCSLNTILSNIKQLKLTPIQNKIIEKNTAILNLWSGKYSACHNIVKKLQNKYPDDNTLILILVSSILSRFTGDRACAQLIELHERNPSNITLSLAIIQFMISSKNKYNAQKILENLLNSLENKKDIRFSPGLVRLIVEIYQKQGRKDLAQQELYSASEYWRSTGSSDPKLIELLYASGESKLKTIISKRKNTSLLPIDDFTYLLKISPNNQKAFAGLVIYYLNRDVNEALKYANKLPTPDTLIQGIDVDHLEKLGIVDHLLKKKKEIKQVESIIKQKRKKSKLPKNYDPDKQPDPERWIPKKFRSSYKPPKGKKKILNRTQGELTPQINSSISTVHLLKHTNKNNEKRK
ncbi:hypothetical protein PCANB_000200 [Pneumocystis canis]|nr:hypothetical protein PCK1_000063 [Pneumocystis canis]KAG5439918.1 hypothetical protein PCANB_000200 [Pneumocystis canis]